MSKSVVPLDKVDKIDVLSVTPQRRWRLVIGVDAGEWEHPDAWRLLKEKLNAYSSYALDGQLCAEHPAAAGLPVEIVIRPHEPVPPGILALLAQASEILAPEGLTISIEPLSAAA